MRPAPLLRLPNDLSGIALALLLASSVACVGPRRGGSDDDASPDDDASTDDDTTAADDDTTADDDDTTAPDDDTSGDDDTPPDPWVADAYLYAHTGDDLFAVAPEAPWDLTWVSTFHRVGGEPLPNFTDLAVNLWGGMYAVSTNAIWHVAPGTGEAELVLESSGEFFVALTFLADGTLLLGGQHDLFVVDLDLPSYEPVVTMEEWTWDGDMVGLPDGLLYCAMRGDGDTESTLVVYDYGGGGIVRTGPTGQGSLFGVGYALGTLFGFTDGGGILTLDQNSGAATVVATPGEAFYGAATNPVRWSDPGE